MSQIVSIRRGFTSLEFMVAMVVLGVALAGLFPLMVMSSRGIESLELRYTTEGNQNGNWFSPVFRSNITSGGTVSRQNYGVWYVIPSPDPWASKLGAIPTFSKTSPAVSSSPCIVDDGDAGYASTAGWSTIVDPNAFHGHYQRHDVQPTPTDTATWTFSNVAPGWYYVLTTWPPGSQASDARYVVYDGDPATNPSAPSVVASMNQTVPPSGPVYTGWATLAMRNFTSTDKKIKVVLWTNAASAVAADGVRIVPVSTILSVDKSFNQEDVTVRVRIGS